MWVKTSKGWRLCYSPTKRRLLITVARGNPLNRQNFRKGM